MRSLDTDIFLMGHFAPFITPYTHGTGCQDIVVASATYLFLYNPVYIYDDIAFAIFIYYFHKEIDGSVRCIATSDPLMCSFYAFSSGKGYTKR